MAADTPYIEYYYKVGETIDGKELSRGMGIKCEMLTIDVIDKQALAVLERIVKKAREYLEGPPATVIQEDYCPDQMPSRFTASMLSI